jgi:protein required for attachment to host cells
MATYVLVCDRSTARLLRNGGASRSRSLTELATLVCPEMRQRPSKLASDRGGRTYARASAGRGPKVAATYGTDDRDPRAEAAARFARRISRRLDLERRAGDLDSLIVVAAPRFLGSLRDALSARTRAMVRRELPRDWAHLSLRDIQRRVSPETL